MSTDKLFGLGLETVDTRVMIAYGTLSTNVIALVLLVNAPRVALSCSYLAYNDLFTTMLMEHEWTSYAHKRKGLRVSHRSFGSQRSTYFLSLPYRFGIPLIVLSGTLHWLVSQSVFIVELDRYSNTGVPDLSIARTCGYSPIAMLIVVVMEVLMMSAALGFGQMSYKISMPIAGSCSLAISAACHPEESECRDHELAQRQLQWGVVTVSEDGIGHCAFSSQEVGGLVKGQLYA